MQARLRAAEASAGAEHAGANELSDALLRAELAAEADEARLAGAEGRLMTVENEARDRVRILEHGAQHEMDVMVQPELAERNRMRGEYEQLAERTYGTYYEPTMNLL